MLCLWAKHKAPPPPCDIPSGCCSFTGPWTVTRSPLRMLRPVPAFCRPTPPHPWGTAIVALGCDLHLVQGGWDGQVRQPACRLSRRPPGARQPGRRMQTPVPVARKVLEGAERGGGGASGTQKFVYQKWPDKIFPIVNFVPGGGGGGRGIPSPPAVFPNIFPINTIICGFTCRRLEEFATAVGGGYCRLAMPLKPARTVRDRAAGP